MEEKIQLIKQEIEALLSRLTVEAGVEVVETADGLQFIIKTSEGGLLIGEDGKNLISLNHVVKRIITKKTGEEKENISFSLDINDYQAKKIEDLKNMARVNAQRVRYFKKEAVLKTMTSFERRIVHATLSDCPDIVTESRGKEPFRQIVIRPYP